MISEPALLSLRPETSTLPTPSRSQDFSRAIATNSTPTKVERKPSSRKSNTDLASPTRHQTRSDSPERPKVGVLHKRLIVHEEKARSLSFQKNACPDCHAELSNGLSSHLSTLLIR